MVKIPGATDIFWSWKVECTEFEEVLWRQFEGHGQWVEFTGISFLFYIDLNTDKDFYETVYYGLQIQRLRLIVIVSFSFVLATFKVFSSKNLFLTLSNFLYNFDLDFWLFIFV